MKVIGTDDDFYDEGYDDDDRSINNRLTFSQEKLYGRQDELVTLHGLYAGLCSRSSRDDEVPSPVAIIDGYSGTGKSALVRCFFDELKVNRKNGYARDFLLVQGKFEELQISDPLSTMADAFQGLCHTLLREEKKETLDRVRKSINASMGVDACALASVIPSIKELLGKSEELALVSSLSSDSGWNRLQYLVQNLLKAVCSEDCPLIMFLDDLQWADPASISLLRAVLSDSSLKKFMFIGAFRGEEIDDQHDIKMLFSEARRKSSKTIERIDLLNLSLRDIKSFIADSLRLSVDECETLTEFVYDKTRGNIYFTMQMMEELQRRNFLFYSIISFQWEWKLGGVNLNAILSENLEDAMAEKIQHAPSKLQRVLVLASYTRSTFHVKTIHVLMSADGSEITKEDLVRILDMAVLEGFLLNRMGSLLYRFAHDRIQQAAYSLVKAGEARDNLRLMIGNTLFSLTENNREDWMLFVAADHLNSSCISGGDSLALARLNLLCGEKARAVAAYVPCAFYLQHAIKYLRKVENHWISQYDLSLRIVRSLCDVELCLGKFHSGDDLAKELIDNARNLEDRLPTLLSLAMSKGRQDRHEEAYELCEKALFDLRAIPRRLQALQMIRDRFIVQRMLRRYTDNDILQLSRLESERKLSEVHFLSEGQLRAYYCGDMVAYMFCCLRSLRIAFKYGLSASSAYSFAAYGLFLDIACEDHEGALRMAQLARQILTRVEESVDSKTPKALALTAIGYSIEAWSCSREHVLETGHLAHQVSHFFFCHSCFAR